MRTSTEDESYSLTAREMGTQTVKGTGAGSWEEYPVSVKI